MASGTPDGSKDDTIGSFLLLLLLTTFIYGVLPSIDGGKYLLGAEVRYESCYEVNLTTDARYEIRVVECYGGPERISVLVHKGPYVVFGGYLRPDPP